MTATPPYGGQSYEIPVISVYSRINPAFSRTPRLFPELIAGVWWLSGVVVVLA
ncbi:TPA: hypothetical protein KMK54_000276 [Escherichia coli]|nr:hypothetical protein [Escherichia coli]